MKICLNVNCNTVYSFINVNMSNLVFYYIYEYVQVMEKVCILWTLRRSHRSALVKKCANLEYMNVILSLKENANVQKSTHLWIFLEQKPERCADKSCSWTRESTACWAAVSAVTCLCRFCFYTTSLTSSAVWFFTDHTVHSIPSFMCRSQERIIEFESHTNKKNNTNQWSRGACFLSLMKKYSLSFH